MGAGGGADRRPRSAGAVWCGGGVVRRLRGAEAAWAREAARTGGRAVRGPRGAGARCRQARRVTAGRHADRRPASMPATARNRRAVARMWDPPWGVPAGNGGPYRYQTRAYQCRHKGLTLNRVVRRSRYCVSQRRSRRGGRREHLAARLYGGDYRRAVPVHPGLRGNRERSGAPCAARHRWYACVGTGSEAARRALPGTGGTPAWEQGAKRRAVRCQAPVVRLRGNRERSGAPCAARHRGTPAWPLARRLRRRRPSPSRRRYRLS